MNKLLQKLEKENILSAFCSRRKIPPKRFAEIFWKFYQQLKFTGRLRNLWNEMRSKIHLYVFSSIKSLK